MCVSVFLFVKSHLTSGASFRHENAATYSAGNEGQKICGIFSETAPLPRLSAPSLEWPYIRSAIFPADNTHVHLSEVHNVMLELHAISTAFYIALQWSFWDNRVLVRVVYFTGYWFELSISELLRDCYIADSAELKTHGKAD